VALRQNYGDNMLIVEEWLKEPKIQRQKHIDLSEQCLERGGNSTNHKGVLAQFLNTNIPENKIGIKYLLCHACHNGKCSNPKHLYWGTFKENVNDSIIIGTHSSCRTENIQRLKLHSVQTPERKRKISAALKGRPSNNKLGVNQYTK
jgi:hypothetical protein